MTGLDALLGLSVGLALGALHARALRAGVRALAAPERGWVAAASLHAARVALAVGALTLLARRSPSALLMGLTGFTLALGVVTARLAAAWPRRAR